MLLRHKNTPVMLILQLLLISLLHITTPATYFVIPDHYSLHNYTSNYTFHLQYYLNNTNKYFVSHNQLHFLPGEYYLNTDLVFKEISDFMLTGHGINQSFIICTSSASIIVRDADSFTLQNISLIDCIALSKVDKPAFYISAFFYHCYSITLYNVCVNISASAPAAHTAIHVRNVAKSRIINVKIQITKKMCHNLRITVNGLAVYYNGKGKSDKYYVRQPTVIVDSFLLLHKQIVL